MQITSSAFGQGEEISKVYTCDGENINPPLEFGDIPKEAKSLVLIVEDPDVPKNIRQDGMFDHWIVFNMPPEITSIDENSEPVGVVAKNTSGGLEYTGPCPPDRKHRYFFKLFALDTILELESGGSKKEIESAMESHILDKAELVGVYERE